MHKLKPFYKDLKGEKKFIRLLDNTCESLKLRSGYVVLPVGSSVGKHTTGDKEEVIVILEGKARCFCERQKPFNVPAPAMIYIPARTMHNMKNAGKSKLKYVYVVSPLK